MSLSREALWAGPTMVLVRHGQCELGAQGKMNGLLDRPLSTLGMEQRAKIPKRFLGYFGETGIRAVLSSWMLRAQMTAEPLAEAIGQGKPYLLQNFQERNLGCVSGMTPEEAKGLFLEEELIRTCHTTYAFSGRHGMETAEQTTARVLGVLNLVSSMFDTDDTVVLVGHGDAMRGGMAGYLGVPMTDPQVLEMPIGYTETVALKNGAVEKLEL